MPEWLGDVPTFLCCSEPFQVLLEPNWEDSGDDGARTDGRDEAARLEAALPPMLPLLAPDLEDMQGTDAAEPAELGPEDTASVLARMLAKKGFRRMVELQESLGVTGAWIKVCW